jgi:hypothetical protein
MATAVEARVKFLEGIECFFPPQSALAFPHFVMQNPKQPRSNLGPPFKTVERLKKNDENVLHQVLGLLVAESEPSRGPEKWLGVLLNGGGEGCRIALAQPCQQQKVGSRRDGHSVQL